MKSSFTDFDPPQSTNNGSDRHTTKTYIGSSVDQSQPVEKKLKSKQAQPKNKRPLSVYNIFYRETRKKILEERGYTESSDEDIRSQSPPKKRGRPRGPNYQKKKTPHHLIGLEELTNEVAVRWKASKDEYHAKYDVVVEEKKQKYKAEKKAKEKSELSETSENKDTSVKDNRYEDSYGGREDNISKYESSSDHNLQSSNCTETSMHFIDRPKSARGISQSEKDIFNFESPMHSYASRGFDLTDVGNNFNTIGGVKSPEKLEHQSTGPQGTHDCKSDHLTYQTKPISSFHHNASLDKRNYSPIAFRDNIDYVPHHQNNDTYESFGRKQYDTYLPVASNENNQYVQGSEIASYRNYYSEKKSSNSSKSNYFQHANEENQLRNYSPVECFTSSHYSNKRTKEIEPIPINQNYDAEYHHRMSEMNEHNTKQRMTCNYNLRPTSYENNHKASDVENIQGSILEHQVQNENFLKKQMNRREMREQITNELPSSFWNEQKHCYDQVVTTDNFQAMHQMNYNDRPNYNYSSSQHPYYKQMNH